MMDKERATAEPTLDEAAALFKVLADPNRLCILEVLMQGDSCNCELNEKLGLPANLLSHHLRVLRQAGLISSRRDTIDGRWIYYTVDKQGIIHWRSWLHSFLDPARIQTRPVVCGPEGRTEMISSCQEGTCQSER
jgi:ArsR family transcriptional regulator